MRLVKPLTIRQHLQDLVGQDAVVALDDSDLLQQARPLLPPAAHVVYPSTPAALAAVVRDATQQGWRIVPMGRGTKLAWGGQVAGVDIVLSTQRIQRLIEHCAGDLTVTAEAGMGFAQLQHHLAKEGQFLALDPAFPEQATLGGVIATADTGSLRQRYGGVRDMVLGLEFVRSDGTPVKCGGRVVKNVAGYDLMKLLTGSWGTLGIMTQVTFRLYPLPQTSQTLYYTGTAQEIAQAFTTLMASTLTPTICDLLSTSTPGIWTLQVCFQGLAISEQAARWQTMAHTLTETVSPATDQEPAIICKVGIPPDQGVAVLNAMQKLTPLEVRLHIGRGVGTLRLPLTTQPEVIKHLRQLCTTAGGYLTILEAPATLKQQVDVWGYNGTALAMMRQLKQQFDPQQRFSPGRFVGGI